MPGNEPTTSRGLMRLLANLKLVDGFLVGAAAAGLVTLLGVVRTGSKGVGEVPA